MNTKTKLPSWVQNHWATLCIGALALIMLGWMFSIAGWQGLWYDEMYQVGFVNSSLSFEDTFKIYATMEDVAPPLFSFVFYFWYRIMPYGQEYLLLLPEIAIAIGVFIFGQAGRKLLGDKGGVLAAFLGAISPLIIIQAGFDLRMYGFLFLFTCLLFYVYVQRYQQGRDAKWGTIVLFGVALALVVYSHYIYALVCLGFFVADIVLLVQKRMKWKNLLSYVIAVVLFLPWMAVLLKYSEQGAAFWPAAPSINSFIEAFYYVTNGHEPQQLLLIGGVSILLVCLYRSRKKGRTGVDGQIQLMLIFLLVPVFFALALFAASRVMTASYWVIRYFTCLAPFVWILCAFGLMKAYAFLKNRNMQQAGAAMVCLVVIFLTIQSVWTVKGQPAVHEPYREAAAWLREQEDIYDEDTLVLANFEERVMEGWQEYYVEEKGAQPGFQTLAYGYGDAPVQKANRAEADEIMESGQYKRVYIFSPHYDVEDMNPNIFENYKKVKEQKVKGETGAGDVRVYVYDYVGNE